MLHCHQIVTALFYPHVSQISQSTQYLRILNKLLSNDTIVLKVIFFNILSFLKSNNTYCLKWYFFSQLIYNLRKYPVMLE